MDGEKVEEGEAEEKTKAVDEEKLDKEKVTRIVNSHKGEEVVEQVDNPVRFGDQEVWQVWVWEEEEEEEEDNDDDDDDEEEEAGGEYDTCYVMATSGRQPEYFENFAALCGHFNDLVAEWRKSDKKDAAEAAERADDAERALRAEREDRVERLIRLGIAAFVFVPCVGALIYMLLSGQTNEKIMITAFTGIIGGGVTLFFRRRRPPQAPAAG